MNMNKDYNEDLIKYERKNIMNGTLVDKKKHKKIRKCVNKIILKFILRTSLKSF